MDIVEPIEYWLNKKFDFNEIEKLRKYYLDLSKRGE